MSNMKILDPLDLANKITNSVIETQEAFIFQTISEFALNNYQLVIEKEELIRAIQLIRMSRKYGLDIDSRWETANQQCAVLDEAYMRGFQDGVNKEHTRFMDFLKREEAREEDD